MHAARRRAQQRLDQPAFGKVEHRQADLVPRTGRGDRVEHRGVYGAFREEAGVYRTDSTALDGGSRRQAVVIDAPCRDLQFAADDGAGQAAAELQRDIAVIAAGVMRIGGGHDADPASRTVVGCQELAVVGLEVEQLQPRTQPDPLRPVVEGIVEPAKLRKISAPPADQQTPQPGVQRIRIAQRLEPRTHDDDAGTLQFSQVRRSHGAVHLVDRVGDQHHPQVGPRALARQQMLRQFARQRFVMAGIGAAAKIVEQEEIQHQELRGMINRGEHMGKDLAVRRRTRPRRRARIVEKFDVRLGKPRGQRGDVHARWQRLETGPDRRSTTRLRRSRSRSPAAVHRAAPPAAAATD